MADRTRSGRARLRGATAWLAAALFCASGCGSSTASGGDAPPAASRAVRDLVAAVTPLPGGATPGAANDWHRRRRETLERLRAGGAEVGREALRVYASELHGGLEVRVGLLDVAAHTLPEDAAPILEELVVRYGAEQDLRAEATRLLGVAAPERAFEILREPLSDPLANKTWPSAEVMLDTWIRAGRALGREVDVLLAAVATDIYQASDARHRAVRELANEESPRAQQALEEVLIEPTGNAYLRRLAAQSLLASMGERSCEIFTRVADREADGQFLLFLHDVLAKNCR